jgi:very-short-patch-repair endonuclease
LSHLAAAAIHGLPKLPSGRPRIHLTVPRGRYPRGDGPPVRQCDVFDPDEHRIQVGEFVVTTISWTLVCLSTEVTARRLQRIYDASVAAGRVTIEQLDDLLLHWWHHPGVVNARLAVAALLPAFTGTRSDAERRFLRILEAAGLPLPEADVTVRVNGRRYVLDFLYRDIGLWIEIDVHPDHGRTIGQRADGLRQNDIVALELTPLRFTADDLFRRPDLVVRQVRSALETRS